MNTELVQQVKSAFRLVRLTTKFWHTNRKNKALTKELQSQYATDQVVAVVSQCKCDLLERIRSIQGKVRTLLYEKALPSAMEGLWVVPVGQLQELLDAVHVLVAEHAQLVAEFKREYPVLRQKMQAELRQLWDPRAWPDDPTALFDVSLKVYGVPNGDEEWTRWVEETVGVAQTALRERFHETIRNVIEGLQSKRYHKSNGQALLDLIRSVSDWGLICTDDVKQLADALESLAVQAAQAVPQEQRADLANRILAVAQSLAS